MGNKSRVQSNDPTKRESEVLTYAREYRRENGFSPSLVEIAQHFDISVPTVHQHVYSLKNKNLLLLEKGKRRSVQALQDHKVSGVEIPMMGIISAGGPIEAIRDIEAVEVPRSMLSPGADYYALRVSGLSMIEEGISDGDVVVVRDQLSVSNGEKVVAYMPERNEVTLKKIYREKNRIKLVPANRAMQPFYETDVQIQGKVVGVIRKEV